MSHDVSLRDIDEDNFEAFMEMELPEHQRDLLASNAYSIAQSRFYPDYIARGIYCDGEPAGFLLYDRAAEGVPGDYAIYRFMVDHPRQGRGIGRRAMALLLAELRARADVRRITICYHERNVHARRFYAGFGFVETGIDARGEMVAEIRAGELAAPVPDHLAAGAGAPSAWPAPCLPLGSGAGQADEHMTWLWIAQRVQALAQAGLAYAPPQFDLERYQELLQLSHRMLQRLTGAAPGLLADAVAAAPGYPTPKVDIRAVLFRGTDEILMVREKQDGGRWSLPGGWADIGHTPFEVAVKEVREETGLETEAVRLLALWDKRMHPHPPQAWYVYKAFVLCRATGGVLDGETMETTEARWVARSELPALGLSTDRVTLSQLERIFAFAARPDLPALCD